MSQSLQGLEPTVIGSENDKETSSRRGDILFVLREACRFRCADKREHRLSIVENYCIALKKYIYPRKDVALGEESN